MGDMKPNPLDGAVLGRVARPRDAILAEAGQLISGDREATYGSARSDFARTGKMWAAILGLPQDIPPEKVAMCMAALKIGRLCHSPGHTDSWVDACGYLALGGDIASGGVDLCP